MKKEISKSVREALKSIPSIDEIINQFPAPIPQDFYKFHLNHLISKIRNKITAVLISPKLFNSFRNGFIFVKNNFE